MYCLKVAVNITAFAISSTHSHPEVTRSSCDAVLQAHPGTNGPASAEPPARTHRAGGTALANVEPEELSYLLASPSPQDSSLQVLLCRRHAEPDTNVTVCSDRAGDHGAAFYHSIAVPGPKLASRGRTFPVHPAASRCRGMLNSAANGDQGTDGRLTILALQRYLWRLHLWVLRPST